METILELLERAIYVSLRSSDVSTRYSSKQMVVLLMDINEKDGDVVAKRILDCLHRLYTGGRVEIAYGIAKMEGLRNHWRYFFESFVLKKTPDRLCRCFYLRHWAHIAAIFLICCLQWTASA